MDPCNKKLLTPYRKEIKRLADQTNDLMRLRRAYTVLFHKKPEKKKG